MPNGANCDAPSLKDKPYCYFHTRLHRLTAQPPIGVMDDFRLPVLEDRSAIQIALAQVLDALCSSRIDTKKAGLMLYALQIASCNLRVLSSGSKPGDDFSTLARRVVRTRNGQTLAARGDRNGVPPEAESRESRFAEMLNDLLHPKDTAPDATPQTE